MWQKITLVINLFYRLICNDKGDNLPFISKAQNYINLAGNM